jgi:hypothetical protein
VTLCFAWPAWPSPPILSTSLRLIQVHGPNNQYLELNVDEISSIRTPRPGDGHFMRGVQCLIIMTNGKFNAVMDPCSKVDMLIKDAGKP